MNDNIIKELNIDKLFSSNDLLFAKNDLDCFFYLFISEIVSIRADIKRAIESANNAHIRVK